MNHLPMLFYKHDGLDTTLHRNIHNVINLTIVALRLGIQGKYQPLRHVYNIPAQV